MTSALVVLAGALAGFHKWRQWRGKVAQEALLTKHRSFFAEVERAWERSHPHLAEQERRRNRTRTSTEEELEELHDDHQESAATAKKRKNKRREEIVEVEDNFEAEVVEDIE